MPCGPGIHWDSRDQHGNERSFYVKKPLISGTSMGELRFLHYLMNHDIRFKDTNGIPYKMEHAYYRGQVEIAGYKVDGYVETADKIFVVEYNGCRYHSPCPHTGCKYNQEYESSEHETYEWYKKETALRTWCNENNGQLIVQWECQWDEKAIKYLPTDTFPRILRPFETKDVSHITNLILTDQLFGFVECDLSSPDWLIKKYESLNFPPIIRREHITEDMLGSYMKARLDDLGRKIPKKGIETVVNSYHCEKTMFFTPMLKWLLELGLQMTGVHDIIQYEPSHCFSKFIDSCVSGRIKATSEKNDLQAQSFKICMNSSYGKLCENVEKYSNTSISRFENMRKEWINPRARISQLTDENVFEINAKPKSIKDDKLSHVGNAVLQLSKLHLLKFIFFIEEHLLPGSFKILYLGK